MDCLNKMNLKTEIILLPGTYNIWDKRHYWYRGNWKNTSDVDFVKFKDNTLEGASVKTI